MISKETEKRLIQENEIAAAMTKKETQIDILAILGSSDDIYREESADEKRAYLEFDKALDKITDVRTNVELNNLATDWYASGRIAGFEEGFRVATKLFVAGMR
jgi:hypothetical protein